MSAQNTSQVSAPPLSPNDLTLEGAQSYWAQAQTQVAQILSRMDAGEPWVSAHEKPVLGYMKHLIDVCTDIRVSINIDQTEQIAALSAAFAAIHSSQFLRILDLLESKRPGTVNRWMLRLSSVGGVAEPYVELFFERLLVLKQARLLTQVFSAERAQKIIDTLERL